MNRGFPLFLRELSLHRKLFLALALTGLGTLTLVVVVDRLPLGGAAVKGISCALLLLLLLATVSGSVTRAMTEPLRRLVRGARSGEVPRMHRGDGFELGELARVFGELAEQGRSSRAELERKVARLEQELAQRTTEFAARNEKLQGDMEQASAAAQRKARLLANMSHEIRTPMNGILGMDEFLLDSPLSPQQRAWAETIRTSTESLLGIIDDILDFSKIEAGKMRLEAIEFDLHRAVEEVVTLLRGVASRKGLTLSTEIDRGVPRGVIGDPMRMRQVLTNLIGNALKFTNEGRVLVRMRATGPESDAVPVRFEIVDTGIGISQNRRDERFLPFAQADMSTTRRFGGTGLGLSISKTLVDLMGGEIGVESQLGVGSTFWFTVRFEPGVEPYRDFSAPEGKLRPRVLVAEGSAAAREQLHQLLGAWDFEHELVADSVRARSALQRGGDRPFGLCLVDQNLLEDPLLASALRSARTSVVRLAWKGGPPSALSFEFARAISRPIRPSALYDVLVEVVEADQVHLGTSQRVSDKPSGGDCSLSILLAEDNIVNQAVAARVLDRVGYACAMAADGRQAFEAVRSGRFDLVLMDCQMPELDGLQATREIRRWERETAVELPVYIVALTANAMPGDRELCLAAGMDDYMSKPIKPQLLKELLQRLESERGARGGGGPRGDPEAPQGASGLDGEVVWKGAEDLVGRYSGRPEELEAFVRDFDQRSEAALGRMQQGLGRRSSEGVKETARELQGVLGWLSSERLLGLAKELERQAAASALDLAEATFGKLQDELARCRALLPEIMARGADVAPFVARAFGPGPS